MKYCSKCGTELKDDAVVCFGCGCRAPRKYIEISHARQANLSQLQRGHLEQVKTERVRPRYFDAPMTEYYMRDVDIYQGKNVANGSSYDVGYETENDPSYDTQDDSNYNISRQYSVKYKQRSALGLISIILAICGIVLNCALALLGHTCGITAIVIGICAIAKAPRDAKSYFGFGLGMACELFAIINSLIGARIIAALGSMF